MTGESMREDYLVRRPSTHELSRAVCGGFFSIAGLLHFLKARSYEAVMPSWIPAHHELVLISGVAEVAGGVAVLIPGLRRPARWWLIALLVAVFPANVHMAINADEIDSVRDIPVWLLWARLPLQLVLIGWVVRVTRTDRR